MRRLQTVSDPPLTSLKHDETISQCGTDNSLGAVKFFESFVKFYHFASNNFPHRLFEAFGDFRSKHFAGPFKNLPALLWRQRLNFIENLRNAHQIEVTRICAPLQCVIRTALFKILRCQRLRFRDRVGEIELEGWN